MIRRFKEEDTTKVMTIWTKGNFQAHDFIGKDYWLENFNKVKNEYLPKSDTYVYTENDDIKGFISILENEYIGALFVRQDSLREGIGRRLLNYCKERYDYLRLNVYEKNMNATLFYVAMNFKNKEIRIDKETRRKRIYYGMEKIKKNEL
ncbi:MAG: N-acetyltransferase [Clostridia bacterium]|nr:N-acetyltransferase [Clostridia bacterium]